MAMPRKVDLLTMRRVLLQTKNAKETAAILGCSDSSVVRTNQKYGWLTLRAGGRHRKADPNRILAWRCETCGLNDSVPCRCGVTPTWAKEVA